MNPNRYQKLLISFIAIIIMQGCAGTQTEKPFPAEDLYHLHVVAFSNETLEIIAKWYTGDPLNSGELIRVNPDLKDKPLRVGETVRIPRDLMVLQPPEKCHYRTVSHTGETLSIIAKWYTGDLMNYKKLIPFNDHLPDPNKVKIGDRICIPMEMLVTGDPIARQFVDSFYPDTTAPKMETVPAVNDVPEPRIDSPRRVIEVPGSPMDIPEPPIHLPGSPMDVPEPSIDIPEPSIDTPDSGH